MEGVICDGEMKHVFEHGQCFSFYSAKVLKILAKHFGLYVASSGSLYFLTDIAFEPV